MLNPFKEVNWKPSKVELKKFGISMLIGFSIISGIFYLINSAGKLYLVFLTLGAACFLGSLVHRLTGLFFYKLIYLLTCTLGLVISNLILIIFYYVLFCGIAITVRLFTGRDPLRLKSPQESNWQNYEKKKDLKRYLKQY